MTHALTADNEANHWAVDALAGHLVVAQALNHATNASYSLTITASSSGGSVTTTVTVTVTQAG